MEPLSLLRQARACGLNVIADGDRLVVRGPRAFGHLAQELLDQKQEVMDLLWLESASGSDGTRLVSIARAAISATDSKGGWFRALRAGRDSLLVNGDAITAFARARWGDGAAGWPIEMLAGFYVLDVLAGLERAVAPWDGWNRIRRRLRERPTRALVPAIWHAFAELSDAERAAVLAQGDPSQSPPGCLLTTGGR